MQKEQVTILLLQPCGLRRRRIGKFCMDCQAIKISFRTKKPDISPAYNSILCHPPKVSPLDKYEVIHCQLCDVDVSDGDCTVGRCDDCIGAALCQGQVCEAIDHVAKLCDVCAVFEVTDGIIA